VKRLLAHFVSGYTGRLSSAGLIVILLVAVLPAAVAEQKIILGDGSEIRGEVVSMQNGVYTVRNSALGTVRIESQNIRSINTVGGGDNGSGEASISPTSPDAAAIQSIKSSIVGNAGLMSNMMKLQQDPAMRAVLADEEVMRAVQNLDLQSLARNPKIKALMNSPEMKSITSQVQ
jgi:hypothetical protein